ncbi:peroxiredoxin family protein [Candidatus Poribacteria bacterium]|nr:peroxiredoxin family protein [Candidatus Poribacteria bacterium]
MNQLGELQKHYSKFRSLGAEMYGISVDAPDVSKRLVVQRLGVQFPILSDRSRETIKAYGVLDRIANISKPATFIIDKTGTIQWKQVGEHKADRVFSDTIIEQLTALNARENTSPVISPPIPDLSTEEEQILIIDLSSYASDDQDHLDNLSWRVDVVDNTIFRAEVDRHQLTILPFDEASGTREISLTLIDSHGAQISQIVHVTINPKSEFDLIVSAGLSLFHLPLTVVSINGESQPITVIGDLFDLLGGEANVNWLITTPSPAPDAPGSFRAFFRHSPNKSDFPANTIIKPETGIIASVKQSVQLHLTGEPLAAELRLHPGPNLIGIPHHNAGIRRLSHFIQVAGVRDHVTQIAVFRDGKFQPLSPEDIVPNSTNDLELTEGQAFILKLCTDESGRF